MTILPICQICNKTVSEMQVERDILTRKILAHYKCHGEYETQEVLESLPNGPLWPTTAFKSSSCQGSRPDTSDSTSPAPEPIDEVFLAPAEDAWQISPNKYRMIPVSRTVPPDVKPIPQGPFGHWHELYVTPAQVNAVADPRPRVPHGSQAPPKVDADILPYNPFGPNTPASRLILAMQNWFREK